MRYQLIVELEGMPAVVQVTPGTYQDKKVWLINLNGRHYILCNLFGEWMQRNEDDLLPVNVRAIGEAIDSLNIKHQKEDIEGINTLVK